MTEKCCRKCARAALLVFNFIFWLSGGVILALGVFLRVDTEIEHYLRQTIDVEPVPLRFFHITAYIMILVGAFVFLVGFCGCCGAVRERSFLLGAYIVCLVIVMCGELAAGIFIAAKKDTIDRGIYYQLEHSIINYKAHGNETVDMIQVMYKCCGINNHTDYRRSVWFSDIGNANGFFVPASCCVVNRDQDSFIPADGPTCQYESQYGTNASLFTHLHSQGCYDELVKFAFRYTRIVICITLGVAALEMIGVVLAVCLCRYKSRRYRKSS